MGGIPTETGVKHEAHSEIRDSYVRSQSVLARHIFTCKRVRTTSILSFMCLMLFLLREIQIHLLECIVIKLHNFRYYEFNWKLLLGLWNSPVMKLSMKAIVACATTAFHHVRMGIHEGNTLQEWKEKSHATMLSTGAASKWSRPFHCAPLQIFFLARQTDTLNEIGLGLVVMLPSSLSFTRSRAIVPGFSFLDIYEYVGDQSTRTLLEETEFNVGRIIVCGVRTKKSAEEIVKLFVARENS